MTERKRVAILGAGGYTGRELVRLLAGHPQARVELAMSARAGVPEPPELPVDPVVVPFDIERLRGMDAVFLCTPHGVAAGLARSLLALGTRVVDLSPDFRLKDAEVYRGTYGLEHACPELLPEAVYGLTEHAREAIGRARLVANPGCYPTSILIPLLPLLRAGLVHEERAIIADSKSGVSGAGKAPSARTHFGAVHENFLAYKVGDHRHVPEIHQEACTGRVVFVPHLLPVFRGILTTLYLTPAAGVRAPDVRACLEEAYGLESFVRVYPRGLPELDRVQRTNFCDLGVAAAGDQVVIVSCIDNLVKGAAGQALQNMNLMLGLPEDAGLR